MRCNLPRLAESISKAPLTLQQARAALLPPIPCVPGRVFSYEFIREHVLRLYRNILRAHRRLPVDMRSLGDIYVKSGASRRAEDFPFVLLS